MNQRQEFLEKLLNQEIEKLRLKCFKYQRRTLFHNPVIIKEEDLSGIHAGGMWKQVNKDGYRFKHEILIDTELLDQYFHYKRKKNWWSKHFNKTYWKNEIRKVIIHEIVHGFVFERYEYIGNIKEKNHDGSPVFLSVLYWVGGKSNHNCVEAFKKSKVYEDVIKIQSFHELDNYLFFLIEDYNKTAKELKEITTLQAPNSRKMIMNEFSFAARSSCLEKTIEFENKIVLLNKDNKILKDNITVTSWEIGSAISPKIFKDLCIKKMSNDVKGTKHKYEKMFCKADEGCERPRILKSTVKTNINN